MRTRNQEDNKKRKKPSGDDLAIRPDLQDGENGNDLSYLNEMPQMAGYEGVVAGMPPPPKEDEKEVQQDDDNNKNRPK